MATISMSNQNTEIDIKPKKMFQKPRKKSNNRNLTSSNTNEILKGEISTRSSTNVEEKRGKKKISDGNKIGDASKQISPEEKPKVQRKGEPFIPTLQDFPELKVHNSSNLSKFRAGNDIKIGYNKSWGNKQKKNEPFPSLSSVISNTKSKTDISNDPNKLTESMGNKSTGMHDVNKGKSEVHLNVQDNKATQLVPAQEISVQSKRNPNKKKRADPIFINLHDISKINKIRTKIKSQKFRKSKFQRHKVAERLLGNYLDSSNPKRSRGKHREIKKKRLSNLKLTIIKERIVKQKLRENLIASYFGNESINFIDNIDFKNEIKVYLKELNERKLQLAEVTQSKVKKTSCNTNITKEGDSCEKSKQVDKIIPSVTLDGNFKFSSKFREYCDNIITPDLNLAVSNLIKESVNLQDRLFLRDAIKAGAKKRHVSGIREVLKYLRLKKVKLVVIAPNLEKLQMEGGLYDVINNLKSTAQAQNVPYAFALDRYKLGRCTKKNLPVSAFAILNYEGIEGLFFTVMDLLQEAKAQFSAMVKANSKVEDITEQANSKVIASLMSAFQEELKISGENSD